MTSLRTRTSITVALAAVLTLCGLAACSDLGPAGGTGTLQVRMVDEPAIDGITEMNVTFSSLQVHKSGTATIDDEGWIIVISDTASVEARTYDILELVGGVFAILGEVELEAGMYTQMRIVLESASITVDGTVYDLFVPSGPETGIKLVGGFTVDPNVVTSVTLDFDAGSSVIAVPPGSTNFLLQPTIRMIQTTLSGSISGTVSPTGVTGLVIAYEAGSNDTVTTTYCDESTGEYVLQALVEGTYDVEISADGYQTEVQNGVEVAAGDVTTQVDFILTAEGG